MFKDGMVSYWVGSVANRDEFNRIIEYSISENGYGGFEACAFCEKLDIKEYDPEDFGGKFWTKDKSLKMLCMDEPHKEQLINLWPEIPTSNCLVVFYNHRFEHDKADVDVNGYKFKFLGSFKDN